MPAESAGSVRPLTERRADELRLSIARVAMQIFVTDGDTTATVERIAEAAGVAPRTFYRHFAVKEDVVLPLFRRSSTTIATAVTAAPPDEDLLDVLVNAFRDGLDQSRLSNAERAFLGLMMTTPQYRSRWTEVDETLRSAVADLIGLRLDLDPRSFVARLSAQLVVNTAREAFEHWLTSDSHDSVEGLLSEGIGVVLAGLSDVATRDTPVGRCPAAGTG